jgi:hypothetical protein
MPLFYPKTLKPFFCSFKSRSSVKQHKHIVFQTVQFIPVSNTLFSGFTIPLGLEIAIHVIKSQIHLVRQSLYAIFNNLGLLEGFDMLLWRVLVY